MDRNVHTHQRSCTQMLMYCARASIRSSRQLVHDAQAFMHSNAYVHKHLCAQTQTLPAEWWKLHHTYPMYLYIRDINSCLQVCMFMFILWYVCVCIYICVQCSLSKLEKRMLPRSRAHSHHDALLPWSYQPARWFCILEQQKVFMCRTMRMCFLLQVHTCVQQPQLLASVCSVRVCVCVCVCIIYIYIHACIYVCK